MMVIFSQSGHEHELVAKGRRDWAAGFEQGFQVRLGGELETEDGFAAVLPVCVAARQQRGLGYPHAIPVAANLNFGNRNDHRESRLTRRVLGVKGYA